HRALPSFPTRRSSDLCPALSTLALSVPKAMVDTGTRACLAAVIASSSDRPVVLLPSESRTMRAAGALAWSAALWPWLPPWFGARSEEHTSELQSPYDL